MYIGYVAGPSQPLNLSSGTKGSMLDQLHSTSRGAATSMEHWNFNLCVEYGDQLPHGKGTFMSKTSENHHSLQAVIGVVTPLEIISSDDAHICFLH